MNFIFTYLLYTQIYCTQGTLLQENIQKFDDHKAPKLFLVDNFYLILAECFLNKKFSNKIARIYKKFTVNVLFNVLIKKHFIRPNK